MTRNEQYAWLTLINLGAVFWWFQMRLLDTGGLIVDQPASALLGVYFVTIAAMTVAQIAISAVLAALHRQGSAVDERDLAIQSRANLCERLFVIGAVNVLIWHALWDAAVKEKADFLPRIDATHLPTLFFLLFTILFIGEAVRQVATIWLYRSGGPRHRAV